MNDYNVTVIFDASTNTTVKADSPQEAAEAAEDKMHGRQHLCHQCAHELDTGDATGCHVYVGDKLVLDTTRAGELEEEVKQLEAEVLRLKREVNSLTGSEPAYPEVK